MSTGWTPSGETVQKGGLTTNGHELARMFSRAQRALECGGLTPLSNAQYRQVANSSLKFDAGNKNSEN